MRIFLTTTALVAALAVPGIAQQSGSQNTGPFLAESGPTDIHASDFIGSRLYTTREDIPETYSDGEERTWSDIGEIKDVVMESDGTVKAILVDLGGFLGIGEKTVAVAMSELSLVNNGEDQSDYYVVFKADRSMLENAPIYDAESDEQPAAMTADTTASRTAEKSADISGNSGADPAGEIPGTTGDDTESEQTGESAAFSAPEIVKEGYSIASAEVLNTENLSGARVYDVNDEWVGDVSELLLDDNGTISEAIIDVGGFLGIGAKPIAIQFEGLTITTRDDDNEIRIYLDATKDQLRDVAPFEG